MLVTDKFLIGMSAPDKSNIIYLDPTTSENNHWPPRFNAELTRKLNFLNINFREALLTVKLMLTIET